jgi:hypothetical protein
MELTTSMNTLEMVYHAAFYLALNFVMREKQKLQSREKTIVIRTVEFISP